MDKCTASSLLQLVSRPNSTGSRFLVNSMDETLPIHVPTIPPHSQVLEQDSQRGGVSSNDYFCLAESTLVPPAFVKPGRLCSPPASFTRDCKQPKGLLPPSNSTETLTSSCLACIQRADHLRGLFNELSEMLYVTWIGNAHINAC